MRASSSMEPTMAYVCGGRVSMTRAFFELVQCRLWSTMSAMRHLYEQYGCAWHSGQYVAALSATAVPEICAGQEQGQKCFFARAAVSLTADALLREQTWRTRL